MGVRENASELCSYLSDTEIAAWDADEEDMLLRVVEDRIYELEDDGDSVWQYLARYVEDHPDKFFAPDRDSPGF
ncbi:MAG TPA: hypothetical protein VL068_07060 [Microthrixaceae bacterium]|nr:hypothetical protein [Microthrixaceae bacterium]